MDTPNVEDDEFDSYNDDNSENVVIDPLSESSTEENTWNGLDLSNRGLVVVSASIANYRHLTSLFIANNRLVEFPMPLCSLTELSNLDLSYNAISLIPPDIENLQKLERLSLYQNRLQELPLEMGRLWRLSTLSLEANPITSPPLSIVQKGTSELIAYMRDRVRSKPPPPDRTWVTYNEPDPSVPPEYRFHAMTYNILAETYATQERHSYVPSWALDWEHRKKLILSELLKHKTDIICLQEVETKQYHDYFKPELEAVGYQSFFRAKSRARTMSDPSTVDGCATFWLKEKFTLVEHDVVEFQSLALNRFSNLTGDRSGMERMMVRDNVASVLTLQFTASASGNQRRGRNDRKGNHRPKHLIVANTHIHWDPTMPDVKLLQVQFMVEEIALIRSRIKEHNVPLLICGDFNSAPSSAVYQLMRKGQVPPDHPSLENYNYGKYSEDGLKHNLRLESAYAVSGEPAFSIYSDFIGVLDYLWFSETSLKPLGVLRPHSVEEIEAQKSLLPNAHLPSDHLCMVAEFEVNSSKDSHNKRQ